MPEIHHTRSNMISKSDYNEADKELTLTFHNGGTYVYKDVPAELHNEMLAAESIGSFFHSRIKGKFDTEKA